MMRPRVLLAVGVLAAGAALALAVRTPSVLGRLRALPADLAAAYREREAELRAALLPDEDTVARARAEVAARRAAGRHARQPEGPDELDALADDDLP